MSDNILSAFDQNVKLYGRGLNTEKLAALGFTPIQAPLKDPPACREFLLYNLDTKKARSQRCKKKGCPICRRFSAERRARQIYSERAAAAVRLVIENGGDPGDLVAVTLAMGDPRAMAKITRVDAGDWGRLQRSLHRGGVRYLKVPGDGGKLTLVTIGWGDATQGGTELTEDETILVDLLEGLVKDSTGRIDSSQGFGKSWAGSHAKNKDGAWVMTKRRTTELQQELETTEMLQTARAMALNKEIKRTNGARKDLAETGEIVLDSDLLGGQDPDAYMTDGLDNDE